MKKKSNKIRLQKNSRLIVIMLIVSLAIIVVAVIMTIDKLPDSLSEREMFMSLQSDMKAVKVGFEKVDEGWMYEEYCAGYGSDVARSNLIKCSIELRNSGDSQGKIQQHYETYLDYLENTGQFSSISATQTLDPSLNNGVPKRISDFSYREGTIRCDLNDTQFFSENTKGISFSCTGSAHDSYFSRKY